MIPYGGYTEEPTPTRRFTCKECKVTWKDTDYTSECWCCGKQIVLLTLNDL